MYSGLHYFTVAMKYESGLNGVKVDKNFARIMYEKSAELGYQPAINKLKTMELSSNKATTNPITNNKPLVVKTGLLPTVIETTKKTTTNSNYNSNLAIEYFKKAKMYECGLNGVKVDKNFAKIMYEKSAELGYKPATEKLSSNISPFVASGLSAATNSAGIQGYAAASNNLGKLNVMRGGEKGFKGFVAEEMQAANATAAGKTTYVLNNNGIADLEYVGKNGHHYYQQMKIGYKPGQIDFAKYKGQTVIVDKGNPYLSQLKAEGAKHKVKVIEGTVTESEAKSLATQMQKEAALKGTETATVTSKLATSHNAGLQSAKSGALYGAGFSIGSNAVDVICGDKTIGEASKDVAKDTAVSYAAGYAVGAVGSAVASTSTGAAAIGAASTFGSTVASSAVGSAVIGASTAASATIAGAGVAATTTAVGAIGAVGSAVGGAAVAATTAVAGTAAGAAVASGVAATAAAGAAVGAAAVAAAPVVAVGAALGATYKLFKKLW